ncbi:MAG: hypothetical protein NXI31_21680, partial [bacterium]|nr:hypothetical protein [bacterium]
MNLFHCHAALASAALSLCITSNVAAQAWVQGHGGNSGSKYWLADTNGDGLDDAIELRGDNRSWTAVANGSHFESPTYTGLLVQGGEGMWGDVNGDGRDDYVRFQAFNGRWHVESASSSGTFLFAEQTWITGHGIGSDRRCLDDVNGDGL